MLSSRESKGANLLYIIADHYFMYSVCHLLQTQLRVEKKEDQIEHK